MDNIRVDQAQIKYLQRVLKFEFFSQCALQQIVGKGEAFIGLVTTRVFYFHLDGVVENMGFI